MTTKVGINGFGRTGRQVLKATLDYYRDKLEVVVVNSPADAKTQAHLFRYDSTYGIYPGKVEAAEDGILVDGHRIQVLRHRDPAKIQWGDYGVELVIESSGEFTDVSLAESHLRGGAKRVIITAAARGDVPTVVLGVNESVYDPKKHRIVSNASCTTNCMAPVVKVLHDRFGVEKGLMSTVHAYTNDQRLLDRSHEDLRRARAAAMSIIPTTTGAARAVTLVIPELRGKLHGMAYRVPTSTVSVIDLVCDVSHPTTIEEVNRAFQEASQGPLKGILEYCLEPLVSIDFKGNPASAIVDALSTMVIGGNMVKAVAWYDNEWAYACRVADLAAYMVDRGL